mmetsp:Transcript_127725/g.346665  ORF Transcript_127725/g.346665 Transcript_127725/m.346665 type:complete len:388 (+) Transcript_127725:1199-2362(+)
MVRLQRFRLAGRASRQEASVLGGEQGRPEHVGLEVLAVEPDHGARPAGQHREGLHRVAPGRERLVGAAGLRKRLLDDARPKLAMVCHTEAQLLVVHPAPDAGQALVHEHRAPPAAYAQPDDVGAERAEPCLPGQQRPHETTFLEVCEAGQGREEPAVPQLALLHVHRPGRAAEQPPVRLLELRARQAPGGVARQGLPVVAGDLLRREPRMDLVLPPEREHSLHGLLEVPVHEAAGVGPADPLGVLQHLLGLVLDARVGPEPAPDLVVAAPLQRARSRRHSSEPRAPRIPGGRGRGPAGHHGAEGGAAVFPSWSNLFEHGDALPGQHPLDLLHPAVAEDHLDGARRHDLRPPPRRVLEDEIARQDLVDDTVLHPPLCRPAPDADELAL